MATETHIAGLQLKVSERYLMQRCAWCGAVLTAYDLERVAVVGEWREPSLFPVDSLVRFSYDGPVARFGEATLSRTSSVVLEGLERLPDDSCALTLPFDAVTA